LRITRSIAASAILLACALGLLGGIVPAIRGASSHVTDALRET
jgi:hypothetical protein